RRLMNEMRPGSLRASNGRGCRLADVRAAELRIGFDTDFRLVETEQFFLLGRAQAGHGPDGGEDREADDEDEDGDRDDADQLRSQARIRVREHDGDGAPDAG